MCGIYGYVGQDNCLEKIYSGLSRLEYRGYDSAGIAVYDGKGSIKLAKAMGKLVNLRPELEVLPKNSKIGIGHTRWATHGPPSVKNAHPHMVANRLAIIHNGIIENYAELKSKLIKSGVTFASETDTEVVLHLLDQEIEAGSKVGDALKKVIPQLEGAFALAVLTVTDPEAVYLAKKDSPLAIGLCEDKNENLFASDALSFSHHTKKAVFLDDGQMARLTSDSVEYWDFAGNPVQAESVQLDWSGASMEKHGYKHYMLKEIHEQPTVFANTIANLVDASNDSLNEPLMGLDKIDCQKIDNIHLVACGTAHYATMFGKYFFEKLCGIPTNVEMSHEFRYREPFLTKNSLLIPVSQSGETADTLASCQLAKANGSQVLAVCNVEHSSIPRASDATFYMNAGPEIGVASTKAFSAMVLDLYLLALALSKKIGFKPEINYKEILSELKTLPVKASQAIEQEQVYREVALKYADFSNFIFIGRGLSFPIAMEGALKLKEISYIHAEGYAGGELKHGPIALIDKNMPVIAIAPKTDQYYEKMLSNIDQVASRQGLVIGLGCKDDSRLSELSNDFLPAPSSQNAAIQAILNVIPLQLFSYHAAVHRGTDVDQPRNLAKSVTVE